jgi:thiamine transport system ATP-binding protein
MDITLENLVLRAGGFRLAGSARIASGSVTAVIGPSGAGKSLLLAALAGFHEPAEGRLLIGGADMARVPPAARPVTALFQEGNLFPHLTLLRNTALGLRPGGSLSKDEEQRVDEALRRTGLGGMGGRMAATLSGGEAGRAALARALLRDRPVLLLDEPFAALGPAMRRDMLGLVAGVQSDRNLTVLMVTHAPDDARQIAQEIMVLADGVIHPPAPARALLDNPARELAAYLGSPG